ncbi:MAG: hypothetical protein R2713_10155 [Ilumatobacteraceae bacterium]|nr:hypothetical protein [Acidimicrobiales bacterium]MCB9392755.1 hypothetical protein [Acidimicrobiaceae bacterium]
MPTPSRENPPFGATAVAAPGRDADTADAALGSVGAVDPDEALRFRAPTLEDAIAVAETALGARVRVIAANRIRRGGIGGFFASDLGVEVTVVVDDESIDDTFDRIVNATQTTTAPHPAPRRTPPAPLHAADLLLGRRFDRRDTAPSHDIDDVHDDVHTELHTEPHDEPHDEDTAVHQVNPVLAEVLAALMAEAAEQQAIVAAADDEQIEPATRPARIAAPVATPVAAPVAAPARPIEPPPTMLRVEQIMAELSAITAEPVFGRQRQRARVARPTLPTAPRDTADPPDTDVTAVPRRPTVLPTLPPRPSEIAQRASQAAHDARQRMFATPSLAPRKVPTDTVPPDTVPTVPTDSVDSVETVDTVDTVDTVRTDPVDPIDEIHAEVAIDRDPSTDIDAPADAGPDAGADERRGRAGAAVPSRRQVELAVAAADQLIESLKRDDGVKRLSVRVVLRSGDQRAVEAEAEWEAS